MRLADFILANIEPILAEWELFAHQVWPAPASVDPVELRDHAETILRAAVSDMGSTQSMEQRKAKSTGTAHDSGESRSLDAASQDHGSGRGGSGFLIEEMIAEYRALRSSVVRLWQASRPQPDKRDIDDLSRFHESIDQSLAQAAASYTKSIDRARQLFLAILGHDMRNPLSAINICGQVFMKSRDLHPDLRELAVGVTKSASAMATMLTDLIDFAAGGLGTRMPIRCAPCDLDLLVREVISEIKVAHPEATIEYRSTGDLVGQWDASRLRQVVSNLIANAVRHGADAGPIIVEANGDHSSMLILSVNNGGEPIPPEALGALFDPLHRNAAALPARHRSATIGLGLYIVSQIVSAHGGTVGVASSAQTGTRFAVRLPRSGPAK